MMEEKEGRKPPCGEKVVRVLTWGGQEGRWWTRESGEGGGEVGEGRGGFGWGWSSDDSFLYALEMEAASIR